MTLARAKKRTTLRNVRLKSHMIQGYLSLADGTMVICGVMQKNGADVIKALATKQVVLSTREMMDGCQKDSREALKRFGKTK